MTVREDLRDLTRQLARLRRVTAAPLLVRAGVFAAGLLAALLVLPVPDLGGRAVLAVLVAACVPALAPRSGLVGWVLLAYPAAWVVTTAAGVTPPTWPRLLALAGCLYLVHTLSALAALLPYDAVVEHAVVLRWLGRAGLVLLGTAGLGAVVAGLLDLLGTRESAVAAVVGVLVAGGLVWLPVVLRRRDG